MPVFRETDCVVEHNGRKFEAGGAYYDGVYITAYLGKDRILTDWHGNAIGTYEIVSTWKINSYISDTMNQVEAFVDGVLYTGRSAGVGMLYNGKRKRT